MCVCVIIEVGRGNLVSSWSSVGKKNVRFSVSLEFLELKGMTEVTL